MSSPTAKATMEVPQVLHMKEGEGEISYFKNSSMQKKVILIAKPILEESIAELCQRSLPECLKMVDLGCSSGPNIVLPLWETIETIESTCNRLNKTLPILQVFLNDLPGNDFNTIFRSVIPDFYEKLEKEKGSKFRPCFIAAMPGNFYGRLFPSHSLHFVHSSCSLHFLSQVPEGLVSEHGIPLNKGSICLAKTSPPSVHNAYANQFERDFTIFLKSRSEEMISGGGMVLSFFAKSNINPHCKFGSGQLDLIGTCLNDIVEEGLIQESILDSFNLPFYAPCKAEVKHLIDRDGSFTIAQLEEYELSWDANIEDGNEELVFDKWERGKYVATYMRAITESMLVSHFGGAIIDDLFNRYSLKVIDYLEQGIGLYHVLIISLTRK